MNYESLRSLCEQHTPDVVTKTVTEALATGKLKPEDISLRGLAEATVGPNWAKELISSVHQGKTLTEAVDVSAFNGITGQIYFTKVMDGFNTANRVLASRIPKTRSKLSGEKIPIPGLSARYGYDLNAGEPFPEDVFGRHWIETPRSAYSGKIIRLAWQTVFFDQANIVLRGATDIGRMLAESIEIRLAAALAGISITLDGKTFNGNTFKWCQPDETSATAYDTYQTTANGAGINAQTGVTLADETSVEALYLLAAAMRHPDTNQPAGYANDLKQLVVTPWKGRVARRIMNATEIRELSNSDDRETISGRGIPQYDVVESVHLYNALVDSGVSAVNAKEYFFLTDLAQGLTYIENQPLQVEQQSLMGSDKAFENNFVWSGRAWEMGQAAVMSPWHLYRSINS